MDARICRTCLLQIPPNQNSYNLNNSPEDFLCIRFKSCVPETNFDLFENSVICNVCFTKVCAAHNFKTKCSETEYLIGNYIKNLHSTSRRFSATVLKDIVKAANDNVNTTLLQNKVADKLRSHHTNDSTINGKRNQSPATVYACKLKVLPVSKCTKISTNQASDKADESLDLKPAIKTEACREEEPVNLDKPCPIVIRPAETTTISNTLQNGGTPTTANRPIVVPHAITTPFSNTSKIGGTANSSIGKNLPHVISVKHPLPKKHNKSGFGPPLVIATSKVSKTLSGVNNNSNSSINCKKTCVPGITITKSNTSSCNESRIGELTIYQTGASLEQIIYKPVQSSTVVPRDIPAEPSTRLLNNTLKRKHETNNTDGTQKASGVVLPMKRKIRVRSDLGGINLACNNISASQIITENQTNNNVKTNESTANVDVINNRCVFCSFKTTLDKTLTSHYRKKHDDNIYKCCSCHYITSNWILLDNHIDTHTTDKRYLTKIKTSSFVYFKCNFCSCVLKDQVLILNHVQEHSSDDYFVCVLCKTGFVGKEVYKQHIFEHNIMYKCVECIFRSRSLAKLEGHYKKEHFKQSPYICLHCGQKYSAKNELVIHLVDLAIITNKPSNLLDHTYAAVSS